MKGAGKVSTLRLTIRYASLLIVIMFAGFYFYLRHSVKDIEPIDDSKLAISCAEVPELENAYPILVQAEIPLHERSHELTKKDMAELEKVVEELETTGRLSGEAIRTVRFRHKERFEMMERAAGLPYSQMKQVVRFYDPKSYFIYRMPNYGSIRALGKMRLGIAWADFENWRHEDALEGIKTVFEAGRILETEDGGGFFDNVEMGISVRRDALYFLNRMLSRGYLPEDGGAAMSGFLSRHRSAPEAWRNAARTDYALCSTMLDDYGEERLYYREIKDAGQGSDFVFRRLFKMSFTKERARRLCYEHNAALLGNADKNFAEMTFRESALPYFNETRSPEALLVALNGGYGLSAFEARVIKNRKVAFAEKCVHDFLLDGTRLRIAALAYKRDNGKLPRTIGELVPKYIDEIPADPFDGEPVRYDRWKNIIYSVGMNLKDDGGLFDDYAFSELSRELLEEKDIAIKIEEEEIGFPLY